MTRDEILALKGPEPTAVDCGTYGEVFIRAISGRERDGFEAAMLGPQPFNNIRARLLVLAVCDRTGARIFADDDAELVGNLPAVFLDQLFGVARAVNGLSDADVEELKKK